MAFTFAAIHSDKVTVFNKRVSDFRWRATGNCVIHLLKQLDTTWPPSNLMSVQTHLCWFFNACITA